MEIKFKNSKIQKLCETTRLATKELGSDGARKLQARLADLVAANVISDLSAGRPHPLDGDKKGQFALNVTGSKRLLLWPDHDPVPKKADSGIDWASVRKVIILEIEDYHD